MIRVLFSELPSVIRQAPRALCRFLSEELYARGESKTRVSIYSIEETSDDVNTINRGLTSFWAVRPPTGSGSVHRSLVESRGGHFIAPAPGGHSKTREALRTVVWNLDAGHFFERTVRLRGVANQFRCVAVD